ncbi:1-phosphofructokinase family hexose kinase [Tsukamurella strandjordii]|uniref:PfkB family carbohydrate kinase n=1 Tax=Tsukamurella strandjordii TaxID=147577 RepID=A0AA90NEX3_9ACTN|nr:PfkB family carbohydrate kinase [Tsukamurella strandjordii]MDP0397079.1 PfkB family carbohydrate kinase [Tsukamurella strandjordii]
MTETAAVPQPPRVLCVTPNPALDITIPVAALAVGATNAVGRGSERLGGKGINCARVLSANGVQTVAMGPLRTADVPAVAGDEDHLTWWFTPSSAPTRRSIAVVEESGRVTVLNERGGGHGADVWDRMLADVAALLSAGPVDVLTINGSIPPDAPAALLTDLIALGRDRGSVVVVDTSGESLVDAARAGADWLKPNEDELIAVAADGTPEGGVQRLLAEGARNILVSRGPRGLEVIGAGGRATASPPAELVGNPTGAGDAAVAGLAESLVRGDDLAALLRRAVAYSAAAVLVDHAGAIHPDWTSISSDVIISTESES